MIKKMILLGILGCGIYASQARSQNNARPPDQSLDNAIEEHLAIIRSDKSLNIRAKAAQDLVVLTDNVARNSIASKATVDHLISALDSQDDIITFYIAAILGNLKATESIPRLLQLLPAADCLPGNVTSARAIRSALKRMKVKPPPAPLPSDCANPK